MTKSYRAKVGFSCPADPVSLKNRKAALKGQKHGEVKWMDVKKGDVLTPPDPELVKEWLERGLVEEVKN